MVNIIKETGSCGVLPRVAREPVQGAFFGLVKNTLIQQGYTEHLAPYVNEHGLEQQYRYVQANGYGGDVLQFAETSSDILAIHRVWLGRPAEHRAERLASGDVLQRRSVTHGCINVDPAVYEQIVDADALTIEPSIYT